MSRDKAIFQSTRPMRGATNSSFQRYFFCHYFNPRAPCGARRRNCNSMGQVHKISIHAPHAGRDCQAAHREPYCTNFNPRAPCGARLDVLFLHALTRCDFNPRAPCGARRFRYVTVAFVWSFQSTRPMRGATFYILPTMRARDISIHAPHAGRDAGDKYITGSNCISIHAPLAGCDVEHIQHTVWFSPYFNPRAPCGARQGDHLGGTPLRAISIHAPHAGRDRCRRSDRRGKYYFNPRAPCGARPRRLIRPTPRPTFQSTRPVRGATIFSPASVLLALFQSTRPVRGATSKKPITELRCQISIHAPRAGRDMRDDSAYSIRRHISIHAPRAGRDVIILRIRIEQSAFQSTRPVRGATMLRTAML